MIIFLPIQIIIQVYVNTYTGYMGAQVHKLVKDKLEALKAAGDPCTAKVPRRFIAGPNAFGFHGLNQAAIEAKDPHHVCARYW